MSHFKKRAVLEEEENDEVTSSMSAPPKRRRKIAQVRFPRPSAMYAPQRAMGWVERRPFALSGGGLRR